MGRIIYLDPGHGWNNRKQGVYDPGCVSDGYGEAAVVRRWCETVRYVLRDSAIVNAVYSDVGGKLGNRPMMAKAADADRLLSVHWNCGGGHGVETYYNTVADKEWAGLVHQCCLEATGLNDRGLKKKNLAVLNHELFKNPSCLLEIGFGDNAIDRGVLLNRDVRLKFAWLLRDAMEGLWS